MQLLPGGQHIYDASQLQHKHGHHIERIFVARIKHIHRPHVDEPHMIGSQYCLFVHAMEVTTKAHVLLHAQHITDDGNIFLWI